MPKKANLVSDPKIDKGQDHGSLEDGRMIFNKPAISNHTKPLYLKTHVNGKSLGRVLVDNGLAVNVIPLNTLLALRR